jgi:predicted dehydrogenase
VSPFPCAPTFALPSDLPVGAFRLRIDAALSAGERSEEATVLVEGESGVLRLLGTGDIFCGSEIIWKNDVQEGYRGDSVRATQRHFVDCLRSGVPFESGGREYLKTFRAVEAAYESVAGRCAIPLGAPVGETAL